MDPKQLTEFEQTLLQLKQEMQGSMTSSKNAGETVELDQSRVGRLSRMDAMQQQAMALAESGRFDLRFRQVCNALQRIETGDYGLCEICDDEINIARLEIQPETPLCLKCQSKQEGEKAL